jgi:hypothetical protein
MVIWLNSVVQKSLFMDGTLKLSRNEARLAAAGMAVRARTARVNGSRAFLIVDLLRLLICKFHARKGRPLSPADGWAARDIVAKRGQMSTFPAGLV